MPHANHFPKTVGVRLSELDGAKLQRLCAATARPPSELLRLLVRLAQPTDLAPLHFDASPPRGRGQK